VTLSINADVGLLKMIFTPKFHKIDHIITLYCYIFRIIYLISFILLILVIFWFCKLFFAIGGILLYIWVVILLIIILIKGYIIYRVFKD